MLDLFTYAEAHRPPIGVPPDVAALFEQIALDIHAKGWNRYSADAVLHQVRWHRHFTYNDRGFKANNNWTSLLARWFLEKHPDKRGFFELRERIHDGYSEAAE